MAEAEFEYDVFLSHNGKDKPAVEHIARLLRDDYNLKAWLDKWNLVPGEAWQEGLENALDDCQTFAVFLGPSGIGPWENEEMRSAIEERVQDSKRRVIPVLLPGAPDNRELKLPRFLRRVTWVDFRSGLDDEEALYRLYCGIKGQAPGDRGSSKFAASKPDTGSRDAWNLAHPYPMPPNFTGRVAELKMLDDWLADDKDRLFILRALGGFGKSALAWQWINTHVNPTEWRKLVWWSFYEGDASFEHFIEETLKYLKLEVPQGQRPQVDELLKAMQSQKILLIMDGFERAMRAYSSMNAAYQGDEPKVKDNQLDCVNINAEIFLKSVCSLPNIKSKVLVTTRLTPHAVKPYGEFLVGCREEELTSMQAADAVEFFHKQGIKGTHAEVETACAPYGYHPLSLRLLVGYILKDFENSADIVVAQKLKIDGDTIRQKHHVLKVSYESLPPQEQKLLSTIACFRSPVELDTLIALSKPAKGKGLLGLLKKVNPTYSENLNDDLQDLVERGLLHFNEKNKKFDLHPIVRRYVYGRIAPADRTDTHKYIIHYLDSLPTPEKIEKPDDLKLLIENYHHRTRAGKLDEAIGVFHGLLHSPIFEQFGAYQIYAELLEALFLDGENKPPRLKNEYAQAWTLNSLALACGNNGQPRRAVPLFLKAFELDSKHLDVENAVATLGNFDLVRLSIGEITAAERSRRVVIDVRNIKGQFLDAFNHMELGRILSYRGIWQEAEQEIALATTLFEKQGETQPQTVIWSYRALRFLLMAREAVGSGQLSVDSVKSAIECAQRALELADKESRTGAPLPLDYMRVYWMLGAAYRLDRQHDLAGHYLNKALTRCRAINNVEDEANILLQLARLRYDQKNYEEARSLAEEALLITERCGYVLQGADVNLFLAQYALEQEKDKEKAKEYAETALNLAYCDGPPYYYKVAYHEAERMLEQLK